MKVAIGDNIEVRWPNGLEYSIPGEHWDMFRHILNDAAKQPELELIQFVSVVNVLHSVKALGITSVELTEDGKYNIRKA